MKRISLIVLSSMFLLALMLLSCQTLPDTKEGDIELDGTTKKTVMVRDVLGNLREKPQYGGMATYIFDSTKPTQILDPVVSTTTVETAVHTYGRLATANWLLGPQGTEEFAFSSPYVADEFLTGELVERWEIKNPQTITFYLRKGVHWQDVPPVSGREFIADDVVYSFNRAQNDPRNRFYVGKNVPEEERIQVIAVDNYTVRIIFPESDIGMLNDITNWLYIMPREIVETYGDLDDPDHQCGTGPFMVEEVVRDVSVTWKRNPNYHMHDPFFPENRLPYLDRLQGIVIVDESARVAALRTHKIDILGVPWDYTDDLILTNPELEWREVSPESSHMMFLRTDIKPFSNKEVRQALTMAINQSELAKELYGGRAHLLTWPIMPSFGGHYTTLEDLPESSQKLYEYHPDLAKQLLADAGYPEGFKTDIIVPDNMAQQIKVLELVKKYLGNINVDMNIEEVEPSVFESMLYGKSYPGMAYYAWPNRTIDDVLKWVHGGWVGDSGIQSTRSFGKVVDPKAQQVYESLLITPTLQERESIRKAESLRQIDLSWEIPLPSPFTYVFWTPWVKGYIGELGIGPGLGENSGVLRYVWIDQDLKSQIVKTGE